MPITEKELNCHLLDMIDLLDDIEEAADIDQAETVRKLIEKNVSRLIVNYIKNHRCWMRNHIS